MFNVNAIRGAAFPKLQVQVKFGDLLAPQKYPLLLPKQNCTKIMNKYNFCSLCEQISKQLKHCDQSHKPCDDSHTVKGVTENSLDTQKCLAKSTPRFSRLPKNLKGVTEVFVDLQGSPDYPKIWRESQRYLWISKVLQITQKSEGSYRGICGSPRCLAKSTPDYQKSEEGIGSEKHSLGTLKMMLTLAHVACWKFHHIYTHVRCRGSIK